MFLQELQPLEQHRSSEQPITPGPWDLGLLPRPVWQRPGLQCRVPRPMSCHCLALLSYHTSLGHLDSRACRVDFPASCLPQSQLCPGWLGLAVPQTSWVKWLKKGCLAGWPATKRPHGLDLRALTVGQWPAKYCSPTRWTLLGSQKGSASDLTPLNLSQETDK